MQLTEEQVAELLVRKLTNSLNEDEALLLKEWVASSPENEAHYRRLTHLSALKAEIQTYTALKKSVELSGKEISLPTTASAFTPTHRMHFLRRWGWAAAVLILLGAGAYLYTSTKKASSPAEELVKIAPADILPGTNRAVLTVGDKTIDLAINKTGIAVDHDITYTDGERIADAGQMLQLTTPNGGQYQAVLPDGSKVWLNAASSIKFPSKFSGTTREIEVTGEAYLEVVHNAKQPFFVHTRKATIQVLGTSFNINSYADDGNVRTTLIEGSVKISDLLNVGLSVTLRPGQQALQTAAAMSSDGQLRIVDANVEQVLAWKNGYFSFDNLGIREMAKQIERWYDIQVIFQGNVSEMALKGEMDRGLMLSDIIEFLKNYGLTTELKGKTLIVSQGSR